MFALNNEALDVIKSFDRHEKSMGVLVLEVNNPVPLLTASRTGWIVEGQLEFYTPWHPTNPDYLKLQATYLAWVSLHLNMSLRCVVKAVSNDIRDGANRIIQEVFSQFGGTGGVQSGMINSVTGAVQMGNREVFTQASRGLPSVDLIFTPFDRAGITPEEERMACTMEKLIENLSKLPPKDEGSFQGFQGDKPNINYDQPDKRPGNRWDGRSKP